MRPIVTDRVALSVGLSVTLVIPAKTAELIEMQFGLWAWMCPWNHVLDAGPDAPQEGVILSGEGQPVVKYSGSAFRQKRLN